MSLGNDDRVEVHSMEASAGGRNHQFLGNDLVSMKRSAPGGHINSKYSDLDRQIGLLKSCECIKESEVRDLCNMARDILLDESNIQNISSPITVSTIRT